MCVTVPTAETTKIWRLLQMNIEDVKVFLESMNFVPVTGVLNIWRKEYIPQDYAISVIFADEISKTTINYGESIICGRKTTCNFSQPESIVVLECVNRLLEKGYHPFGKRISSFIYRT